MKQEAGSKKLENPASSLLLLASSLQSDMKRLVIFIMIVTPIVALLYFSLTRNPRELPSALIGKPAPDFTLQTLDGESITLSSAKGHPVVLNFWSTWCGSCLGEHRLIRQAHQAMGPKGVVLYSVLYEDTPENAKQFMKRYGTAAPVLLDPGLKTAIDYGVAGVPETFFIDKEGIVRYKQTGMLTPEVLWGEVEQMQ